MLRPFRIVAEQLRRTAAAPAAGHGDAGNGDGAARRRRELRSQGAADAGDADVDVRDGRWHAPTGSKAAVKEARGGDLGGAAMTALGEDDQVLATFLKGLELYQAAQLDQRGHAVPELDADGADLRAVAIVPRRRAGGRQSPQRSGGLDPERVAPRRRMRRSRGSPAKNGSRPASRRSRFRRSSSPFNSRRRRAIEESCSGSPTCWADERATRSRCWRRTSTRIRPMPRRCSPRSSAPTAGTSTRRNRPRSPADRANLAKWSKAYAATKGPMQPLVAAWVKHVQDLK